MKVIVAMRGRNPENPSERVKGGYVEQRLEVNSEGICNCITTVQKDNLVMETRDEGNQTSWKSQRGKVLEEPTEESSV